MKSFRYLIFFCHKNNFWSIWLLSIIWIYVMSWISLTSRSAFWVAKILTLVICCMQAFSQIFPYQPCLYLKAPLVSTFFFFFFNCFYWPSTCKRVTRSVQSKRYWLLHPHCWFEQNEIWCGYEAELYVGMHCDIYESIWCKVGMTIDTIVHFDTSLVDLDLMSQECEKTKSSASIYITKFLISLNGIWYTVAL